MARVEFFFDLSSPWTRIAFANIQAILLETGSEAIWRPFLVGGVFNAVNSSVYQQRDTPNDPKVRRLGIWLHEWASLAGVRLNFPSAHHPLRAVLPMRVCCLLEEDQNHLLAFMNAAFDAYFVEQHNLDEPEILIAIANKCGFDGAGLVAQALEPVIKDRLRSNTDEAIQRGAFGSPTIFVDNDRMYFGNDQLPLVAQALRA